MRAAAPSAPVAGWASAAGLALFAGGQKLPRMPPVNMLMGAIPPEMNWPIPEPHRCCLQAAFCAADGHKKLHRFPPDGAAGAADVGAPGIPPGAAGPGTAGTSPGMPPGTDGVGIWARV